MTKNIQSEVRYLKGVGPRKSEILSKIGIQTVQDLLYYLPRRYEDRRNKTKISDIKPGSSCMVQGKVLTSGAYRTKKGTVIFQLALTDGSGVLYCVWFNQPFLKDKFKTGQEIIFFGKAEKHDKLQMAHPEYEIVSDEPDLLNVGRIVPVYPLTQELTQKYMRFLVNQATEEYLDAAGETIPTHVIASGKVVDIYFALKNIHFPNSYESLDKSYRRIVFEDFFVLQAALALKKAKRKIHETGKEHKALDTLREKFSRIVKFNLTGEQKKAQQDIEKDMASPKPMSRLLEGEVGSGKTVLAIYALFITVSNGFQGAIMAPTEILARQHYLNLSELLLPLGINVSLLVSGITREDKSKIKKDIKNGEIDIVCGTHALIQEDVEFKNLGLAVIDEQHKFGVEQRNFLKQKGKNPDILVMTATPIPRTLALTVYGDLDISLIKELPKGRRPVKTFWLGEGRRDKTFEFIKDEAAKGRQAYIVYPRLKEKNTSSLKSAENMFEELSKKAFPGLRLGLMHGKLSSAKKTDIMKKFKNRKFDVLVSTVVIEVGIDVPNATCMLIENAESFGLSQIHQLRGRIGRGEHESFCILISDTEKEDAQKRLSRITQTQDGLKIAEEDLELRGPGEFFGTKQHGLPELRFGNILKDFEIMKEARSVAFSVVAKDPYLKEAKNIKIKQEIDEKFSKLVKK